MGDLEFEVALDSGSVVTFVRQEIVLGTYCRNPKAADEAGNS